MEQSMELLTQHLASYLTVRSRSIRIDGQDWRYYEQGKGDEVCLFLHGVGGNILLWRSMMQSYGKRNFRCLSPNLPGLCLQQFFQHKSHTIHQLSHWLDSFLAAVDAPKVNIVAHSTSCLLGIYFAATRSSKVNSLTLVSLPNILRPGKIEDNKVVQEFLKDADFNTVEDWQRYIEKLFYRTPTIPNSFRNHNYKVYQQNREKFFIAAKQFMPSIPAVMPHLKRVTCPVLAINGKNDPYSSPDVVSSLQHHFRYIHAVNLARTGHISFLEKPKTVASLHQNFLLENTAPQAATVA